MSIEVFLFARLREIVGEPSIVIHGQEYQTVADVWGKLCVEFPQVKEFGTSLIFAVNQEFANPATSIGPGDEVAFFPPVTGG